MRIRTLLILASMVLGVMLLGGVALAVNKTCTTNRCGGTNGPDRLIGADGKNQIYGFAGPDYIDGMAGADKLYGGPGNDRINASDGYSDDVYCGPGEDTVYFDLIEDDFPPGSLVNCEHKKEVIT